MTKRKKAEKIDFDKTPYLGPFVCTKCNELRCHDEFVKHSRNVTKGLAGSCKSCTGKYYEQDLRTNPAYIERINKASIEWNNSPRNVLKRKRASWKSQGIVDSQELDRAEVLFLAQAKCDFSFCTAQGTSVDHDHENGIVRGWVCIRHNVALGAFGDQPETLQEVLEYTYRSRSVLDDIL